MIYLRASVVLLVWLMSLNGRGIESMNFNNLLNTKRALPFSSGLSASILDSVSNGSQMAVMHCQEVFKWDRWNCPESAFSRRQKYPLTKETAYIRAIISAALVHSITEGCSRGQIEGCGCDPKLSGKFPRNIPGRDIDVKLAQEIAKKGSVDWAWGGCSDYVEYGEQMAQQFLDNSEQGRDIQAYANLQNNLVGRTIIRESMVKKCKCHGISTSCQVQTCWMQLAPFSEVAMSLKEKYHRAVFIDLQRFMGNSITGNKMMLKENGNLLVYLEQSPNYCVHNQTTNCFGTKGRICSRPRSDVASLAEKKSCRNLCRSCGYKVRKQTRQVKTRCNCKFNWCCEVTCETCTDVTEEYFCE